MFAERIYARQAEIMADEDYRHQLILTLAEKNPGVIDAAVMGDSRDWMTVLANLHEAISCLAFEMALGEARAKDCLQSIAPNNVHQLNLRGVA